MSNHLQFNKWKDSAFSTEQLRTTRWLLNSKAKNMPEALQEALTVSATAQAMLMELHVRTFLNSTRRMKPSSRGKARASVEEFEKLVDFSCIFARLRHVAKEVRSDNSVDDKLMEAFLNKHLGIEWKLEFVIDIITYNHQLVALIASLLAKTPGSSNQVHT